MGGNKKAVLAGYADRIRAHQAQIARLEEQLDAEKKALRELSEVTVPKFMDSMDGKWSLDDGRVVEIKTKVRASIRKDDEIAPKAYAWLEENGHGALIKNTCLVEFSKDQWENARELFVELRKRGLNVKRDRMVHHSTLTSWVVGRLKDGKTLPFDLLGIHRGPETKIKDL